MSTKVEHPTLDERHARGLEARTRATPDSHVGWRPAGDRPDPVALIEEQNLRRDADLVPVRHGRMSASPFTFYRGAAAVMAADLAQTPTAGLEVQLCGDAHLSNFGAFGSPERQLVFDINDFDETLPGPFEYDVKRLAASVTVAARNNGFAPTEVAAATAATVAAYREAMAEFASMTTLDVWYAHVPVDELREAVDRLEPAPPNGAHGKKKDKKADRKQDETAKDLKKLRKRFDKNITKARSRDSLQAMAKLTEVVDGHRRITGAPPVVIPARDLYSTYGID